MTDALRKFSFVLFFFVLFSSFSAQAETQYWVSVGSYSQQENAAAERDRAAQALNDNFTVIGASTVQGYFYRVAAGPYLTRELAEDRVRSARSSGFSGAWLWVDDSTVFESSALPLPSDAFSSEDEYVFPDVDEATQFQPDTSYDDETGIMDREKIPELVEEPPPGFKLNKLRRDAWARPPPDTEPVAEAQLGTPPSQLLIELNAGEPITLLKYEESQINMNIDGKLDESVWGEFPGVDQFVVIDPDTGERPRHRTVVKMFYTQRGLYAAFVMEQPAETLVKRFSGRDDGRLNRDNVGITLDTSGEGRYGYWINLALGGNQVDGTVLPEKQFSRDWDGAWLGGTTETLRGWNAEIFLPWSQMAMPKEAGRRVLNAYASRKVAYLDERWAVPALPFTQPLFLSALHPLVLDSVDPRQQWSFFPFVSVTQDEVEDTTDHKIGADLFWRPSTDFQLTATLNPDFGNVESDDVIVNLSAFETFFPEKRLFFKEGIEVFNATPRARSFRGAPTTLLHTRRIGGRARAPSIPTGVTVEDRELAQPIELLGAAKVVGQIGKVRYGILGASEDEAKFDAGAINLYQDGSDYGVMRFLYEDRTRGSYKALGLLSTMASHPVEDATAHGVDFHYLSNGGDWKVDGQLLTSDVDSVGTGYGGFADVSYTARRGLRFSLGLSHFDDQLDINDLGFLRRNDATNLNANVNYTSTSFPGVRSLNVFGFAEVEVNGDGDHTRRGLGTRMNFNLDNRDEIKVGLAYFPERDEDRNSFGNGTYIVDGRHSTSLDYITDTSKRVSYSVGVGHSGEEQGGSNFKGRIGINWRPVDRVSLGAFAEYTNRDGWLLWQEDRNFTTFETREWRPRLSLDYYLTAKQQLRFSAQWVGIKADEQDFYLVPDRVDELVEVDKPPGATDDFAISRVNLQLRYRWEIAPLSELFVVYTLNGEDGSLNTGFDDLFDIALEDPVGEQLVVKLRYRLGT